MKERIPTFEGRDPYIFVSYAHKNSSMVMPIIESLFNDKYRVWYDEGIAPGSEWPKNIADHLKAANTVLVFVSKESLLSSNCENEIVNSKDGKRNVIQFSLDGSTHRKLEDCTTIKNYNDLKKLLDDNLIGDGVTGYKQDIGKAKKGNYWTGLIVFAFVLLAVLATGLYGLNNGWFNDFLPGLQKQEEVIMPEQEIIQVGENIITNSIIGSTNSKLRNTIIFESSYTKEYLYNALNIDINTDIKYQNLVNNNVEELVFEKSNDELLEYMQYFPKLKVITILNGEITSLDSLLKCANLELVKINKDLFPTNIPEEKLFEVEYIK